MLKIFTQGFSLIELMTVITIIGILTAIAVPSYQHYVLRARFVELINLADIFKTAVTIAIQEGDPLNEITTGVFGIPDAPKPTKHLDHLSIANGIITIVASNTLSGLTYILKPNFDGTTWTISGTCLKAGLCHD